MYAKMVDGSMIQFSNPIRVGNRNIITNVPTKYGYKQVISEPPETRVGWHVVADGWEETEDAIVRTWHEEPDGEPSEDNHPKGEYFEQGGALYRATRAIVRGERIREGINVRACTVMEAIESMSGTGD